MNASNCNKKYNERLIMRKNAKERIKTAIISEFQNVRAKADKKTTNSAIIRALALKYGCSYSFVSDTLLQSGTIIVRSRMELNKQIQKRNDAIFARYQQLRAKNENESDFALIRVIAAEFDCGYNTIYRVIRANEPNK